MSKLIQKTIAIWSDEKGLTTVEYAIAGALVSLAVVTAFTSLGTKIAAVIGQITAAL